LGSGIAMKIGSINSREKSKVKHILSFCSQHLSFQNTGFKNLYCDMIMM